MTTFQPQNGHNFRVKLATEMSAMEAANASNTASLAALEARVTVLEGLGLGGGGGGSGTTLVGYFTSVNQNFTTTTATDMADLTAHVTGTGVSVASGVITVPTGNDYLIVVTGDLHQTASNSRQSPFVLIRARTDGSTWSNAALSGDSFYTYTRISSTGDRGAIGGQSLFSSGALDLSADIKIQVGNQAGGRTINVGDEQLQIAVWQL